jgi:hypothetical protein
MDVPNVFWVNDVDLIATTEAFLENVGCALAGEIADVMNICPACGYPMYGPGFAITDDLTPQPIFSAVNSPSALPSPPGGMRESARALVTRRL